jgi:hypothetical protein
MVADIEDKFFGSEPSTFLYDRYTTTRAMLPRNTRDFLAISLGVLFITGYRFVGEHITNILYLSPQLVINSMRGEWCHTSCSVIYCLCIAFV